MTKRELLQEAVNALTDEQRTWMLNKIIADSDDHAEFTSFYDVSDALRVAM